MKRICALCEKKFTLLPDHKGLSNRCSKCNEGVEEPERLGGCIHWEGKHTPVIEITTLSKARAFNKKNVRLGVSVLSSIACGQSTASEREATGMDSGANPGSSYRSNLREGRMVKR